MEVELHNAQSKLATETEKCSNIRNIYELHIFDLCVVGNLQREFDRYRNATSESESNVACKNVCFV